jgi:hypothetical protein
MDEDQLERFLQRLAEAIDWCSPRATLDDPKNCLRTPELAPHPLAGCRKEVVDWVHASRNVALRWPRPHRATDLAGGRLLSYEPDVNLFDGAAAAYTQEFFDVNNTPPWDTWVDYVESDRYGFLVSWVPPCLIDLVGEGIWANPEMCIWWLDQRDTNLSHALSERGYLQLNPNP